MPAQHRHLMPKHHDLQLLKPCDRETQEHHLQHTAQGQVAERPEQEQLLEINETGARLYG
jgi:hypothetical protein